MRNITQRIALTAALTLGLGMQAGAQSSYREDFLNPKDEHRSLIIWQWMFTAESPLLPSGLMGPVTLALE